MVEAQTECTNCGAKGEGKYCQSCGQKLKTERLSIGSIVHEVFHFFTHLDHGFPFTFKKLATSPGTMQRQYIEGQRARQQKPFSMFFICATIAALVIYWVNLLLIRHFNAGDNNEAMFIHKYWVVLQTVMIPFFALVTYLLFIKAAFNYGEIIVFQLYLFSFLFIMLSFIHLLKFIFPHLQTRYIELPAIIIYTVVTNLNFFKGLKKLTVIALTIIAICTSFFVAAFVQDYLVESFS